MRGDWRRHWRQLEAEWCGSQAWRTSEAAGAPATTTTRTAGAGPGLVVHHADRGGALPQLRHLSRCHGASGPSELAQRPAGPAFRGLESAPRARRGLLLRPPASSWPPGLFSSEWAPPGRADSGFTSQSAVPASQACLPPMVSLFSPFPNSAFSALLHPPPQFSLFPDPCPPGSFEVFPLLFGGAQSLGRLN